MLRKSFILFLLLIVLNILLRLPISFNEIGYDSFVYHNLANSLSLVGYAKWWLHPLSISGMYPYSIGSSLPFLLSGFSQTTSLRMDYIILAVSIILGLLSIFFSYLMAGSFYDNKTYQFIVAFGYSTSLGILNYTNWTAGSRALFIVILPIFIYLAFRTFNASRKNMIKYAFLCSIVFLLLFSTHKMFYFLFPFLFSFVVFTIIDKFNFKIPTLSINLSNLLYFCGIFIALFIPFFFRIFAESGSRYGWLLLIMTTYLRYVGIAIAFVVSGFAYVLLKDKKTRNEHILLTSLMFLSPFIYILTYMKWFMLSFLFLLFGIGLNNIIKDNSYLRIKKSVFILVLLLIVLTSSYVQYIHFYNGQSANEKYLNEPLYTASEWATIHISDEKNMFGLFAATGERFFAISEIPTLTGVVQVDLTFDFINKTNLDIQKRNSVSSKTFFDSPYISNTKPTTDWYFGNTFIYNDVDDKASQSAINKFNLSYVVENSMTGNSNFLSSIKMKKSCFYDNGNIKIRSLHG